MFAILPLHRNGRGNVRNVLVSVDVRSIITIRSSITSAIAFTLAKQPLDVFYTIPKAPLFLGAPSVDVLPVVLSNTNPDTYTEQDVHDLHG